MTRPLHLVPIIALGALAYATCVSADDYQTEISAGYSNQDAQYSDADQYSLSGRYYFKPVDTSTGPLAEAAFLQRSSSVALNYTRGDWDYHYPQPEGRGTRGSGNFDSYSVNADFYLPNSIFYAGLTLSHGEAESRNQVLLNDDQTFETFSQKDSDTRVSAELGLTPLHGLLISSVFYEDQDLQDDWNLGARWVTELLGSSIALDGRYQYADGSDLIDLGADFYFDRSFSIGLSHATTLDYGDYTVTHVRARKFFTEAFALEAGYSDQNDGEYHLAATLRF